MKDVEKLLKLLPETLNEEELREAKKSLNRSAYKILTSIRMTNEEKMGYVKFLKSELEKSGQTSIGLNDYDARWMINIQETPQKMSADTIYNTKEGLNKLEQEQNRQDYIPIRKQSKTITQTGTNMPTHTIKTTSNTTSKQTTLTSAHKT